MASYKVWVLFFFCLSTHTSYCWQLPPSKFIQDFATEMLCNTVIVYAPNLPNCLQNDWLNYLKSGTQKLKIIDVNRLPKDISFLNQELHLFLIDDQNIDESVTKFNDIFSLRNKTNEEFWLVDVSHWNASTQEVSKVFQNTPLDIDDDLYMYSKSQTENEIISILELYEISKDLARILRTFSNWKPSNGLMNITNKSKWIRRQDLNGLKFNVQAMPELPLVEMRKIKGRDNEFEFAKGIFAEVFEHLKVALNFTFVLRKPPDLQWGAKDSNGNWNGMINEVMNGKTDFAMSLTITTGRDKVVTFSSPIKQIHRRFFIKNPAGAFNLKAFSEPFTDMSWLSVALFCILCSPFMYISAFYGKKDKNYKAFTIGNSLVFTLSSLILKDWSCVPAKGSSRIVFFFLMFGCYIIYLLWEAMIITYLSTRVITLPFFDLKSLLETSSYKIGLGPGTSSVNNFKFASDPLYKQAWTERIEPNMKLYEPGPDEGYKRHLINLILEDNPIAIYGIYDLYSVFDEYLECEIIALPAKYDFATMAIAMQKHSPFLGLMNHHIRQLDEKGVKQQIVKKYELPPQVCPDYNGKPIGYVNCGTAFLILLAGFVICVLIMLIENSTQKKGLGQIAQNSEDCQECKCCQLKNAQIISHVRMIDERDDLVIKQASCIDNLKLEITQLNDALNK